MTTQISFESKKDWRAFVWFMFTYYALVLVPDNWLGVYFNHTFPEITAQITTPHGQRLFDQIIDDARWFLGITIKTKEA